MTEAPPDGYYWYEDTNFTLEVVQVLQGHLYQCGSDIVCVLHGWPNPHKMQVLDGRLAGEIREPPAK